TQNASCRFLYLTVLNLDSSALQRPSFHVLYSLFLNVPDFTTIERMRNDTVDVCPFPVYRRDEHANIYAEITVSSANAPSEIHQNFQFFLSNRRAPSRIAVSTQVYQPAT